MTAAALDRIRDAIEFSEVDRTPVIICRGPVTEERSRDSMGIKWCFKCRSRHEFFWIVLAPVIDWNDEDSIYAAMWGPTAHSECSGCGRHDGQLFPGWTYNWDADE